VDNAPFGGRGEIVEPLRAFATVAEITHLRGGTLMKMKLTALVVMLLPLFAIPSTSYAALITYSTLGRFNGGAFSSSPTITVGGGNITFNALGTTSVDPGNLSYGTFDSNAIGSGGTFPRGTTFDLQVNQTTPAVGTATESATLSGVITPTASTVRLTFLTTSFAIDGVSYTIDQPLNGIAIVSPASNGGLTTIQGAASVAAAPEPSTWLMLTTGLLPAAWYMRNRSRSRKLIGA